MLTDPKSRPAPLTALALVCFIAGALFLLSGLSLVVVGGLLGMNGVQVGATDDPLLAFLFGFATLALAAGYLALYFGFWELRPWAFTGGFMVAGAGIVMVLIGLPLGFGDATSALSNIVVGVAVMGVLLLPSSQLALGYVQPDEAEPAPAAPAVATDAAPIADLPAAGLPEDTPPLEAAPADAATGTDATTDPPGPGS
jgi:hypothetical protein